MYDELGLQTRSDEELLAMLQEFDELTRPLVDSASERFKQSEMRGWDEEIFQEGMASLAQLKALLQDSSPLSEEIERRLGPAWSQGLLRRPASRPIDNDQRWYRSDLTTQTVPVSGYMDQVLAEALSSLLTYVPPNWWREQERLAAEYQQDTVLQPLLLYGSERWRPEFKMLHEFGYYLSLTARYLNGEPLYDLYTAARAIPQICSLGTSIEDLKSVRGSTGKLRDLWRRPGSETDSTIFELLVAAGFVRMGHGVSFIETAFEKTPDLRLHGQGIPLVAECKRKQVLNAYEAKEFSVIREVFALLCSDRERLGLIGELVIDFKHELVRLPAAGIAQSVRELTGTPSPHAKKETEWGSIQFKPNTVSRDIIPTRLYSPQYLEEVFGIDLQMDDFDGICAVDANKRSAIANRAELPFLMKWTSNSRPAIEKKSQTVLNLWVEAANQIPTGEVGLIYVAYEEGHRPYLADARTDAIRDLVESIYFKRRAICMPMTVISRIYPNAVREGRPDLIENAIPLVDGDEDDYDYWSQNMPTLIFTP